MSWISAPLGEITTVLSGTTPKSQTPAYWNGKHVWVTPTDLGKLDSWTIKDSQRHITDAGAASCNLPLVPAQAIVMSSRAPIGHMAIAGCELRTNQGCKSFVCSDALDPEFLFLTLRSRMHEIQALGNGATFVEVSKSTLEMFEISFPKIDEQRRIATRLKTQLAAAEQARQAAQAQAAEVAALRQAIYREAFATQAGKATVLIGDVAKVQSGYAFKSKDFAPSGVYLLRNTNVLPGQVYWQNAAFLAPEHASAYQRFALQEGDVIISLDRPLISSGIKIARVSERDLPALLVQRVGRFQIDASRLFADYLYAYLGTEQFKSAISGHDQSVGVPHISPGQIQNIELPLPGLPEQERIVAHLNQQLAAINTMQAGLQARLADIEALPARLLAQAFEVGAET